MKNLYLTFLAVIVAFAASSQTITGSTTVCVGGYGTLSGAPSGGTWSSSDIMIATVYSGGIYIGHAAGTATITYTTGSGSATTVVTVTADVAPFSGSPAICLGSSTTYIDTPSGGTWSSSSAAIIMITSGGVATGISLGATYISYTLGSGCTYTGLVTVVAVPAAITGPGTICEGSTATMSSTPGIGMWSSSGPVAVAYIGSSSGVVTAVSSGTTTITYTNSSTGCFTTRTITVSPVPAAITGPSAICVGSTGTMSCSTGGGTWSSSVSSIATISTTTGIAAGVSAGVTTISYALGTGCAATKSLTVNALPTPITGTPATCVGTATTLSASPAGGTWGGGSGGVATIGSATGIVTGVGAGTAVFTYSAPTGCFATVLFTVNPTPPISGTTSFCVGGTTTLSAVPVGGSWTSASPIITVDPFSGVVAASGAGTVAITYTVPTGCFSTIVVTASAAPSITVTELSLACSANRALVATGGGLLYTWTPAPLGYLGSGSTDTALIYPAATTYTVTSTTGCPGTTTFTSTAPNRILGHISFGGPAPSGTSAEVWLIQFNPTDSSITAQDSLLTCLDGSSPYYEFDGKPAGSYLVKAKLLSSVPGTSDYLPTYGASSATWDVATPVTHAAASDSLHIAMLYGTVPSGPGFISGYVYMGAGKGTSGEVPAANMIVYLKNASGTVLTYTYTDATGAYSFGSLGYGSYVIYPEEMSYYTIPSSVITLSSGGASAGPIGFKKRTSVGTIEPWSIPGSVAGVSHTAVPLYPNPANDMVVIAGAKGMQVTITDVMGREVYKTNITSDRQPVSIAGLANGIYIVAAGSNKGEIQRSTLVKQ